MKRITVLLGAGAMIDAVHLGTKDITDRVFDACKNYKLQSGKEILKVFAKDYAQKHKKTMNPKEANFEDLFDILECYMDYQNCEYNDSGSVILSTLRRKYKMENSVELFGLRRDFIEAINESIHEYDQKFTDEGTWMSNFFQALIKKENCCLDFFTLNYDTWIEQILGDGKYVDGFVDINSFSEVKGSYDGLMRFSPTEYLTFKGKHTVAHLHGQICFEEAELHSEDMNSFRKEEQEYTLYKYKTYNQAKDYRKRHIRSLLSSQAGHTIFPTNIITGRMKTDKMVWSPLQIYMHGLMNALMSNEELIIVGYGFGDLYINTLLFQYLQRHKKNKHVRLITFCSEREYDDDVSSYGNIFNGKQCVFAQCVMSKQRWCTYERKPIYYADDRSAEIYINGFKQYCEDYISGKI